MTLMACWAVMWNIEAGPQKTRDQLPRWEPPAASSELAGTAALREGEAVRPTVPTQIRLEHEVLTESYSRLTVVVQIVSLMLASCAFIITSLGVFGYFNIKQALYSIVDDRVHSLRDDFSHDVEKRTSNAL